VEKEKEEFISDFSEVKTFLTTNSFEQNTCLLCSHIDHKILLLQEDYNDIVGGWSAKLERTASGEQKWGLFIADKK